MEQKLYDLIAYIGPVFNDKMHVISNGANAFLVHLYGGVFFELIKDEEGVYFEMHWQGPLRRCNPVDVIAWIMILEEPDK